MNKLALIVISALSLSSAAALADTVTVNGGTVHFKGEVVNAACWFYRPDRSVRPGSFCKAGDRRQHQHGCRLQYPAE